MKHKLTFLFLIISGSTAFAQWTQVGSHISNTNDSISANLTHNNITGFDNNVYCCTDSGLFVSNNNGDTWFNMTDEVAVVDNERIFSFIVADNNDLFLGSHRRLYKSVNNGLAWTWLSSLPDSLTYNDIAEINGNIVFSYNKITEGGAYYSSDGGINWIQSTGLPNLAMREMEKVVDTLYLAGKDGVYKSTDNGQTWVLSGTGFPVNSRYFDVVYSEGTLFAGDVNGNGMWASYDNGVTWINPYPTLFTGFCQVMSFTESGNIVLAAMSGATCSSGGTSIKSSTDNGQTWNTFMDGLPSGYYPTLGKNADGTSFFSKSGKKVYRYDLVTGIEAIENELKITVSPNPFSFSTTISIDATQHSKYDFIMYDISGKQVLSKQVNSKFFTLENEGFSKGMYFYRLIAVGEIVAKGKLIIE